MLIGIAGKAASGKTTAAGYLQRFLGEETLIVPMAMVLRDEVVEFLRTCGGDEHVPLVYGSQEEKVQLFRVATDRARRACPRWDDFLAVNREIQDHPGMSAVTVRRLLQWWGTEYRRAKDPDYWTKAWGHKIEQYPLDRMHILVDDVRFLNEVAVIRAHGGRIVKIERPGFLGANNHSSETSLDDYREWDAVIRNDGSLEQLADRVAVLAEALLPE